MCVLHDINLSVEKGEFVVIVGYSGAGKTTLISLIADLLKPDAGTIALNDLEITAPGPDRGIVFQNYSLLPWLNVYENIYLAVDQVGDILEVKFPRPRDRKQVMEHPDYDRLRRHLITFLAEHADKKRDPAASTGVAPGHGNQRRPPKAEALDGTFSQSAVSRSSRFAPAGADR